MSHDIDPKFGIPCDPMPYISNAQPIKQPPMHSFIGGFLTGAAIVEDVKEGLISIEPYDENNINPNSYNLTIGNTCKILDFNNETVINPFIDISQFNIEATYRYIDAAKPVQYTDIDIPEEGLILRPGELYLIATNEIIGTDCYIPMITGRSSMGRMGVSVHQEAGFGDIGYHGKWTLQVTVVKPVKIYPNMKMAQMYMVVPSGDTSIKYKGKYQNSNTAKGSEIAKEF